MRVFTGIYNCLLWSLLIATFCFNDSWLQMRVNIGYVFVACWIVLTLVFLFVTRHTNRWHRLQTVINVVVCFLLALVIEGTSNLAVIPASFIREGLHTEATPFSTVDLILGIVLVAGLVVCLFDSAKRHKQ